MIRTGKALLCVLAVALFVAPLAAQDAVSAQKRAQNRVLAHRAARADAMRKLGERINGLAIDSRTTVKDFVTESDVIRTAMQTFLLGMREKGRPEFSEDGNCTVRMEVTLQKVISALRRLRSKYYKGGKFKAVDFTKISTTSRKTIISVVGSGSPRPEQQEDELVESVDDHVSWAKFSKNVRTYWKKYCTGRGRLTAERAARLDAMRRLVERIKGTRIDSRTTVRDFVTEDDVIEMGSRNFLRGAREIGVRYHSDELIVEVEMQVKLKQVLASVHKFLKVKYRGDRMKLRKLEQKTMRTEIRIIKETGMGVPPERYLRKATPVMKQVMRMAKKAPMWATSTKRAVGQGAIDTEAGNAAQAKLMAFRAAELDARRKLAEEIEGLAISSNTSVRDFVTESDEIRTSMLSFQQGARIIEKSKKIEDGVASVTVEIELKPLWNTVIYYKKKLGLTFR